MEDSVRFPFGRLKDSSSMDYNDRSKFGEVNDIDGDLTDSDVKIWYGQDATEGEFPFMVKTNLD